MLAPAYKTDQVHGIDGMWYEYEFMEPGEDALLALMKDLFEEYWSQIVFGPCIQGAVYEVRLVEPPKKLALLDGYLTVDLGEWHFHLCLGRHKGTKVNPTSDALAQVRRPSKAAFFRSVTKRGGFGSWGFQMWNGADEQMMTVFFPNPYLSDRFKFQKPDWTRLKLWNEMRQKYLPGATEWVPDVSMSDAIPSGH